MGVEGEPGTRLACRDQGDCWVRGCGNRSRKWRGTGTPSLRRATSTRYASTTTLRPSLQCRMSAAPRPRPDGSRAARWRGCGSSRQRWPGQHPRSEDRWRSEWPAMVGSLGFDIAMTHPRHAGFGSRRRRRARHLFVFPNKMDTLPVILFQFGVESAPFQTSMPRRTFFSPAASFAAGHHPLSRSHVVEPTNHRCHPDHAELATRWPRLARASDLVAVTGISFVNIQKTVHALAIARLLETSSRAAWRHPSGTGS